MLVKENNELRIRLKYMSEAVAKEQLAKKTKVDEDLFSNSSFNFSSKLDGSTTKGGTGVAVGKRIEEINKFVLKMIQAKAPVECALATLRACKEAFRSYSRVTLFIFDTTLQ
jgi:hypothetical protein